MVLNPEKCSFMLLGVDDSLQTNLVCGDEILKNTKQEKVFKSQITCCSLIWMFCTKPSLRRINNIHERCQRLIQENYRSEFERLLENANEKSVHQKCIEFILIEVYKYLNGLSPDIISTIFKLRQNTYNLRNFHAFESQNPRTKKFGLDSIAYRASQLWKKVSKEKRNSASLSIFKESIKYVPLISCSCHCCKTYIHHVGCI